MGINCISFNSEELDSLAEKLALLYIQKVDKTFSSPREFTHFFVQTQELIAEELTEIRKNE